MMVFMLLGHLSGSVAATGLNSLTEAEAELRFHSFVLKFFDFLKFKPIIKVVLFHIFFPFFSLEGCLVYGIFKDFNSESNHKTMMYTVQKKSPHKTARIIQKTLKNNLLNQRASSNQMNQDRN